MLQCMKSFVAFAKVAPKDDDVEKHGAGRASRFSRWLIAASSLAFIMAMVVPNTNAWPGWLLGWSFTNFLALLARAAWTRIEPLRENRYLILDLVRGVVLQHIITFHIGWSFRHFDITDHMCFSPLSSDRPALNYCVFCLAVVAGHALLIPWGLLHTPSAEVYFTAYSWALVTTWTSFSSRTGMALMCLVAGYTSTHRFNNACTPGTLQRYAVRALKHMFLLGIGALLITLVSYVRSKGRRYICTGALHLLLAATLVHLPFLFVPRMALAVGTTGVILRIFGYTVWEPRSCGGFDHQPFQLGLSAQLLGIGFCYMGVLDPLHRLVAPCMTEWVQIWMGQNSLVAYLSHQIFIYPSAWVLAFLLPLGWTPGDQDCSGGFPSPFLLWLNSTTASSTTASTTTPVRSS